MKIYNKEDLERYLSDDWIAEKMENAVENAMEDSIRTNKWLREMDNKRMIYADVYGDLLLQEQTEIRVLDVGGGYNALTKVLAQNTDYYLLDYMAHGGDSFLKSISDKYRIHWINDDWYNIVGDETYDIIIANDIFPDVDQRIELFIDKFLPLCREMRLVVTYYNAPCFYNALRTNDTEKLTFLSWDGEITALKMKKYLGRITDTTEKDLESMKESVESIYRNGRQVAYLTIQGDLRDCM